MTAGAANRPSYHRARIERERSNDICSRACKPCEDCGQHIPKERTPTLCSKCAPVGEEVTAHVVTGISECSASCGADQDGGHWHSLSGYVWAQFPRRPAHRTATHDDEGTGR